jgi:hypothetical protein
MTTTPDFPMYYLHEGKYKMFPDTFSVIEVGESSIEYKTFLTKVEVCSMVVMGKEITATDFYNAYNQAMGNIAQGMGGSVLKAV